MRLAVAALSVQPTLLIDWVAARDCSRPAKYAQGRPGIATVAAASILAYNKYRS